MSTPSNPKYCPAKDWNAGRPDAPCVLPAGHVEPHNFSNASMVNRPHGYQGDQATRTQPTQTLAAHDESGDAYDWQDDATANEDWADKQRQPERVVHRRLPEREGKPQDKGPRARMSALERLAKAALALAALATVLSLVALLYALNHTHGDDNSVRMVKVGTSDCAVLDANGSALYCRTNALP